MAVTNEKSTQVSNQDATPVTGNPSHEVYSKLKIFRFKHTQGANAGDAGSDAILARIPAGQGFILKQLSVISWTAFGAARTLDIGYKAHTKRDGTAVPAGLDILEDGRDVSAANVKGVVMGTGTNADDLPYYEYDSKAPIDIVATVAGGTWPAGAIVEGWIAYTSAD